MDDFFLSEANIKAVQCDFRARISPAGAGCAMSIEKAGHLMSSAPIENLAMPTCCCDWRMECL
jgi:hypothetical protein